MKEPIKTWSTPVATEQKKHVPCALCGSQRFIPALDCGNFSYVRCTNCQLVQMNPQPESQAVQRRYGEAHGQAYLEYELANEKSFLRLQQLALRDIGFNYDQKGRFLDVGCATGALLADLREKGWSSAGVELCDPSAEYARTVRALDIRTATIEAAAFEIESFDVVHASHLIEHLAQPRSFVQTAGRLLRPGGILLVTTPNIAGFQARLFGSAWRSAIFDHLYLFSKKTLSQLLQSEGFTIEKTVTWGGLAAGTAPLPLKKIADRAVKVLGAGDVVMIKARR